MGRLGGKNSLLSEYISTLLTSMAVSKSIGSWDPRVMPLSDNEQTHGRLAQDLSKSYRIAKRSIDTAEHPSLHHRGIGLVAITCGY